jgi:hypothetical protein
MPSWGDLGAAAAMLVWQFVWNLLTWLDARRLLGVDTSLLPARS